MRYWKFFYRCTKGRGAGVCSYDGEVAFSAEDLADAMRRFRLWAASRPSNRQGISMTGVHNLDTVPDNLEMAQMDLPATEQSQKNEEEENMKIKKPDSKFVLIAEGEHLAKLTDYEDQGEQEDRYNPGETTHRVQLIWQVKGGSKQFQWVKVSLHPMSRLYEIATALLGENPPDELEMDDLVNKTAYITIEHYKGEDGRMKSKVTDIRPAKFKGRIMPKPEPKSEPEPEPEPEQEVMAEEEDVPF